MSWIFSLGFVFNMSKLKSPTIRISLIVVSKASPIEVSIDVKVADGEFGGL